MLPWSQIIGAGFVLADVAREIYNSTKKNKEKGSTAELNQRIELLEINQLKQAELLSQMAEQNKILLKQVRSNFLIAVVALVASLICLVLIAIKFMN